MPTYSGSLTSKSVSATGNAEGFGNLTFTITGTFVADVYLERATTPQELSWERVTGKLLTGAAGVIPSRDTDRFRIRAAEYTSGTVTFSFSPPDTSGFASILANSLELRGTGTSLNVVRGNAAVGGTLAVTGAVTGSSSGTFGGAITATGTNFVQAGNNVATTNVVRILPVASGSSPGIQVLGPDTNTGLTLTLKGTGALTVPRVSLGSTQVLSGSSTDATQMSLFSQHTVSGTITGPPYRNLNQFLIQGDNVACSGPAAVQGLTATHLYGGAAMSGSRIAFSAELRQTAATQNSSSTFYQAGQFTTTCSFPEPGSSAPTLTDSRGLPFALGATGILSPAATNYQGIAGMEVDVVVGAQPFSVLGLSVVRLTNGYPTVYQAAEPSLDVAFKVGNGAGATSWMNGYTITSPSAQWALDATQGRAFTLFDGQSYDVLPSKAAYGIHLQACQFSEAAFLSQGAKIDGTGIGTFKGLNLGGWSATLGTTGVTLDTVGQIALSGVVAAGGTDYKINEKFTFGTGGIGIVTGVSGGIVSTFTILQYPIASSPPANPLATTSMQNTNVGQTAGSGLTLTLTWSTADGLKVGGSSAKLGFFGATPAAKPTGVAVSSAGIHAALVTLGLIAA